MATTLKVKNTSGAPIQLDPASGLEPLNVNAGAEVELSEKQLKGKRFLAALQAGSVSFANVSNPSAEQIALAAAVLPAMVSAMRERIARGKNRFDQSQADLIQRRQAYNAAWTVASRNLEAAQAAAVGWPALEKAVQNLLLEPAGKNQAIADAKAAVKAVEEAIKDLNEEDLSATGRSLAEWFDDRRAREQELAEAKAGLEAAKTQAAHPLVPTVENTTALAGAIAPVTQDQAIGKEIPGFGP